MVSIIVMLQYLPALAEEPVRVDIILAVLIQMVLMVMVPILKDCNLMEIIVMDKRVITNVGMDIMLMELAQMFLLL